MSSLVKRIILEHFNSLKKDLQDDIIVDCLELLSADEQIRLNAIADEDRKVEEFLKIVSNKPLQNLQTFIEKLQPWYSWLHEVLNDALQNIYPTDQLFNTRVLGGIPSLPELNITRLQLLEQLKNGLRGLEKGHYIVLHGMVGCGKTCLAVEALNDIDILQSFGNQVYWLTVGSEESFDPMLLLEELNARIPIPLTSLPTSVHRAVIELNKRFIEYNWTNSLIVLDDVTSEYVISVFNIAAKFLIISKDKGVISQKLKSLSTFIKVNEGFTEGESQQLLAKALDIKAHDLPHYASDIFKYTKGHPFSLSLFVSQLQDYKEDFLNQKDRWEHYINNVLSKGAKRRRSMNEADFFFKPIEETVNSLPDEHKELFRRLAVFVEDVNIKREVLAILWGVEEFKVDDIMLKFVHKSLAIRKYNDFQKCYVYGIHDLIGDYLKKDLSSRKEKELHANLVEGYRKACHGDWSKLPEDDNYIYYYLGYHLMVAEMFDLFPKIYFDLQFLQAKLRVTGPGDLLRDFNKYKQYISNGESKGQEMIVDYCNFIEHFGVWINQGVDIVQAALQTSKSSSVHIAAVMLAQKKVSAQRYLRCLTPFTEKPMPQTVVLKDNVVCVCFGRTINEAIIASGSGKTLEMYNFKTKSVKERFVGHTGKINFLHLSPSKSFFLSASMDNTIRIWPLESSETSSGERTPSPRELQNFYIDLIDTNEVGEKHIALLPHKKPVLIGLFGKTSDSLIASLCADDTLTVWKDMKKLWDLNLYRLKSIDFCKQDELVVAASNNKIIFFTSETGKQIKTIDHPYSDSISLTTTIDGEGFEGLALLCKTHVTFYQVTDSTDTGFPMNLGNGGQSPFLKFCTIGSHIAVSTEDGALFVFHSENGQQITYLPPQKKVVSFCVDERAILAGCDDGKVFLYPLDALKSPLTKLKWVPRTEPVIARMNSIENTIEVYVGETENDELKTVDTENMDISEDGKEIVTVTKGGCVKIHSSDSEQIIITRLPAPSAIFLLGPADERVVVLSYNCGKKTLVWRKKTNELIRLPTTSVESAYLFDYNSSYQLFTAYPFTIWNLDGKEVGTIDLDGRIFCFNPQQRLVAVSTVSGLDLCQFNALTGEMEWRKLIEHTNHIDVLQFSPSGNKLALIQSDGIIKVYDCNAEKWEYPPGNDILKKAVYLAVSDSGCVCYGGNGLVSIVASGASSTTAVLDLALVKSDPNGSDVFAVVDKTGHVCKIHQDYIH